MIYRVVLDSVETARVVTLIRSEGAVLREWSRDTNSDSGQGRIAAKIE